ncbi:PBP1A family penicillin-binding protein [Breoghania sp. L-A4]|uniref:PBP1A family penicillin-binding protein n=1 Tax=Breoghania sp. L-A4 TaxID=2304600 RepID=UPI000E35CB01|nr:PBP1A family penicillin-binding protein [Breoghania sp. L-A4]AXS38947.1 PBP1A family penicillin-binding protein [Breoghania sp. L-A4]
MVRRRRQGERIEPSFERVTSGAGAAPGAQVRPPEKRGGKPAPKSSVKPRAPAKGPAGKTQNGKAPAARGRAANAPSGRKRGAAKSRGRLGRLLKRTAYWSVVLGIWGIITVAGVLAYYAAHLPPSSEWRVPNRPPNIQIVSVQGRLIANRGDTGGEAVRLEQLPAYLPNAVIAIEDRRFRSHFGIDPIGLARAMVTNLTRGTLVQGGSTLTQQLAKNLFLKPERTISRKMQEVVLSLWLEAKFSKDEILEMYLNRVYFGAGAYGVDGAARRYFGKSARQVSLAEAATLAALLKAPSRYAPTRNPDLAERRAQLVLTAMHDTGFISADQAKNAIAAPAQVVSRHNSASENYVADWAMELLDGYVGPVSEDLIVDTTIDLDLQRKAEKELRAALADKGGKLGVTQGAIVTLDTSGAIKALVGGRDYASSQFNRAVVAMRQPGSAFKPFVYLAALESGLTPETMRVDRPISIKGWQPKNYTKKYYGPVSLKMALAYSLNTVAASLANEVGPARVARTAQRLGISSPLKANPSLALGTSEVTPLELTAAYVPFSNGGYGVVPHVIRSIRTQSGEILYQRTGGGPGQVIQPDVLREINSMMAETLQTGTGKRASLGDRPAGGKTGTSQDLRDAWFIGFTADLVTGVWLGNDDNSPTKGATGGSLPAGIWHDYMLAAHEGVQVTELPGVPVGWNRLADSNGNVPVPPRNLRTVNGEQGGRILPPPSSGGFFRRLFGG